MSIFVKESSVIAKFFVCGRLDLPYVLPEVRTTGRLCFRRSTYSRLPTAKLQVCVVPYKRKKTLIKSALFVCGRLDLPLRRPSVWPSAGRLAANAQRFAFDYRSFQVQTKRLKKRKTFRWNVSSFLRPTGLEPAQDLSH